MDSLIYDEEQARRFYRNIVCADDYDESKFDFFTLSARRKYLNSGDITKLDFNSILEKVKFKCNNEELFIKKLKKVDSCLKQYKSLYGIDIPINSMVFYMSVNHLSQDDIYREFKQESDFSKNKDKDINLKQYFETAKHGTWIDLDLDVELNTISYLDIKEALDSIATIDKFYFVIGSHTGYHILLNTKKMDEYNKNYIENSEKNSLILDYKKLLSIPFCINKLKNYFNNKNIELEELMVNLYYRVPIPGTLQGGRKVILYD